MSESQRRGTSEQNRWRIIYKLTDTVALAGPMRSWHRYIHHRSINVTYIDNEDVRTRQADAFMDKSAGLGSADATAELSVPILRLESRHLPFHIFPQLLPELRILRLGRSSPETRPRDQVLQEQSHAMPMKHEHNGSNSRSNAYLSVELCALRHGTRVQLC